MRRFTQRGPCPICGGFDSQPRGKEQRCHGFLSDDGKYAHCTRGEHAGGLLINANSATYAHRLDGDCNCGVRHGSDGGMKSTMASSKRTIAATYDYRDANGKFLFQVVRWVPKGFQQRRPDGRGDWIWNRGGIDPVPYRLPELLAAEPAEVVFLPEGEADVENLGRLGLLATTNPGGAGKWRQEYSEYLRGRSVAILPDNDKPGHDHAEMIAKSLVGVASSVKVVKLPDLPEKGDVSDWLEVGGTIDQLRGLLEQTAVYKTGEEIHSASYRERFRAERKALRFRTAAEVIREAPSEVKWLVKPWVAEGCLTMLTGKVKAAGKTTFAMHMVAAVLDGTPFLGEATSKTPVVYLTEQPSGSLVEALKKAGLDHQDLALLRFDQTFGHDWQEIVESAIAECRSRGAKLLVIDTLAQFTRLPGDSENNAGAALSAVEPLQRALADGIAVLVIMHERKSGGEVSDSGRGSSAFAGVADVVLTLQRPQSNTPTNVREIRALSRFSATPSELVIELTPGGYIARGLRADVATAEAEKKVLALLPDNEMKAMSLEDITAATGVSRPVAQTVLRFSGIERVGQGVKGNPYRYYKPKIHSAGNTILIGQKEIPPSSEGDADLVAVRNLDGEFEEGFL
jgi:hypothetical protein